MKIIICGSMTFSKKMVEVEKELLKYGHSVILPKFTKEYAGFDSIEKMHSESAHNKIIHDLIKGYFNEIEQGDSILVINEERKGINGYIGGNSLIEMAFAHVLGKKIFLLNPVPEMSYTDEIIAMKPAVINNDLGLIK
jgi:predicted RNA-binding protein with PUA domain